MKRILSVCIIFCLVLMLSGCGDSLESLSPDDELSEYVCSETDGVFTYIDKVILDDGVASYTFHGWTSSFTKENVTLFLNAVTSFPSNEKEKIKINLVVGEAGGQTWVCSMSNYYSVSSNGEVRYIDYPEICVFSLGWPPIYADEIHDPNLYAGVEGVRYLFVEKNMKEVASDKGIDWYEIWPDLEGVEIF